MFLFWFNNNIQNFYAEQSCPSLTVGLPKNATICRGRGRFRSHFRGTNIDTGSWPSVVYFKLFVCFCKPTVIFHFRLTLSIFLHLAIASLERSQLSYAFVVAGGELDTDTYISLGNIHKMCVQPQKSSLRLWLRLSETKSSDNRQSAIIFIKKNKARRQGFFLTFFVVFGSYSFLRNCISRFGVRVSHNQ